MTQKNGCLNVNKVNKKASIRNGLITISINTFLEEITIDKIAAVLIKYD